MPAVAQASPFRRLVVAALMGTAGVYLLQEAHLSREYAAQFEITALILLVLGFTSFLGAWAGWDEFQAEREARRKSLAALEAETSHGESRFAGVRDLKRAGMLKNPASTGIFLGRLEKHEIYHNGEGSVLVLAPPGMGKTTALAIPHGLQNATPTVCIDPKGELYATTAAARRRLGHRIWLISPWSEEIRKQTGGRIDLPDGDGFDPIAWLDCDSANVIADANLVASLLIPKRGSPSSDNSDFFQSYARELLVAFTLHSLAANGFVTLTGLRRTLMSSEDELDLVLATMMHSEAFSGELQVLANRIQSTRANAPKQWLGVLDTALNGVSWADSHSPLGKSVKKNGVDWARFYDVPTTVYIVAPPDAIAAYGDTWLASCITVAQELLARARRREKVTFLIDEFQNLGRQDALLRGLALYRSLARYIFAVQYVSALERLYGPSWREFLGCEVVMAFGATSDHSTLKLLSELAGSTTITKGSLGEQESGVSANTGNEGRPLIRPEEIRTLPDGKALIFAGNLPPILADKLPYYRLARWRRRAAPNPYK